MSKYRKRPVIIEATPWFKNGDHPEDGVGEALEDLATGMTHVYLEGLVVRYYRHPDTDGDAVHEACGRIWREHGWIDTLEGGHTVCPGDWIITGIAGERYPCKPDIFAATYEAVEAEDAS